MKKQNKIFAAIDESGNYGLGFDNWGKYYLVISMVIIPNESVKRQIEFELEQLKARINKKIFSEFKYSHSDYRTKTLFFNCIAKHNFKISLLVIDKRLSNYHIQKRKDSFCKSSCFSYLLSYSELSESEVILKIDGKTYIPERKEIKTVIRQTVQCAGIQTSFINSKSDIIIQVSDMIAGAVADKYKNADYEFYNIIKDKIICEI